MNDPSTEETGLSPKEQRAAVRNRYARIATASGDSGCQPVSDGCCDGDSTTENSERLGYSSSEVASVADGADLGLGCGNPNAIASLEAGETVLDLGSGAGFDCFLAAREVGRSGQVIGVDMTPEMVEKARSNVERNETEAVEFRLGEIEHLPVADETIDVVISNCVVNLSPNKPQVFEEAYRVLRPGGRLAISDVVMTTAVPSEMRADPESVASCVSGASTIDDVETMLSEAGFSGVTVAPKHESESFIRDWDETLDLSEYIVSATITGRKDSETDRTE